MSTTTTTDAPVTKAAPRARIEDLYGVEGKAELVGGRIIHLMGSGELPTETAFNIAISLRLYAQQRGVGKAYPDGLIYGLRPPLPHNEREAFVPDASYSTGPVGANRMRYIVGVPALAVEVRNEGDYGRAAERDIAAKRTDYSLAGTLVGWDVAPVAETGAVYRTDTPELPTVFRRGETADTEPAAPGWRITVDEIFQP